MSHDIWYLSLSGRQNNNVRLGLLVFNFPKINSGLKNCFKTGVDLCEEEDLKFDLKTALDLCKEISVTFSIAKN